MADYQNGTVTVGTTASVVLVSPPENDGLLLMNRGPNSAFLGGPSVTADQTSTGGLEILPGEKLTISTVGGNLNTNLYAVTSAGSSAILTYLFV